jgi:hypothetical protein
VKKTLSITTTAVWSGNRATKKSVFDLSIGPTHIVLYCRNIEAVCSSEAEVRYQIRQTLIHEPGHYFGTCKGKDITRPRSHLIRPLSINSPTPLLRAPQKSLLKGVPQPDYNSYTI